MSDFIVDTNTISPLVAVLCGVSIPWAFLVLIELILRAFNNDDDDDDGGKGIRIRQPQIYNHTHLQEHNMPFIVFGCVLAATAFTNVFSFVFQ